jgi:hypothetical protein
VPRGLETVFQSDNAEFNYMVDNMPACWSTALQVVHAADRACAAPSVE